MKIVNIEQMRELEHQTEAAGLSMGTLMEKAGLAVAETARTLFGGSLRGEHATVLVGPGNNGGDGLVCARHLNDWGVRVHLCLCAGRSEGDQHLEALREYAVDIIELGSESSLQLLDQALGMSALVVDAVLGTGHSRAITGSIRQALERLKRSRQQLGGFQILAVDVPSGLDADTGASDAATPSADVTVALGFPKIGLFSFPGAAKVGRLEVVDIGIPPELADSIDLDLLSPEWVNSVLPRRPIGANKGTFGRLMVVAGSADYIGAAYLACAAAVRAGAGLVTLATPRTLVPIIAPMAPEVTYLALDESDWGVVDGKKAADQIHQGLGNYGTLLVGCGLSQRPEVAEMVRRLLVPLPQNLSPRIAIDADGLNNLARVPEWWHQIQVDTVLTPHPGEMRRLSESTREEIEADRLGVARSAAAEWRKTVLLKGPYSIVASADGKAVVNPFANPGLATAGTGDVLAGIVSGLLTQGLNSFNAAAAGAYIHAAAAERIRSDLGDSGMAASDLLLEIPRVIRELRS
ncbi:NAD(P)H-hydrate dehydratase [Dehalococcoidia bacterium]|nr:NAD(P)H-hydrate dehydratase [Dehalococcoidia bacterium]